MNNVKMVIVARNDLLMQKGKLSVQVGHAASALFTRNIIVKKKNSVGTIANIDDDVIAWLESGTKKIVVGIDTEDELLKLELMCLEAGIRVERIVDAGLTVFNNVPTLTCIAIGPAEASKIDQYTKHLQLL